MRLRFVTLLLLAAAGCGEAAKAERLALEDVPESVLSVAREKLPDVKFEQAIRKSDGVYEVSGKDSRGKVHEIEISPDGEIVEIE
jgi:hypothetical protein